MNRFVVTAPETKRGFWKVRRKTGDVLRETICMSNSELYANIVAKTLNEDEVKTEDAFDVLFGRINRQYTGPINPVRDNLISILENLRKGLSST